MASKSTSIESPYLPVPVTIESVESISATERLFRLSNGLASSRSKVSVKGGKGGAPVYSPGQFFMVGLPGYGEAPISVCAPYEPGFGIELCIRLAGNLTGALHRLGPGDTLWLRGPYGTGFDTEGFKGLDIIFIAGGIGIAPMRSLLLAVLKERKSFGALRLLYGAKSPEEVLFTEETEQWQEAGLETEVIVDKGSKGWKGRVGLVTDLMGPLKPTPGSTRAVVIGPPVMYRFVVAKLKRMGLSETDIQLSLERRMKCGVGKCGHCQINSSYVCQDGPVYGLGDLKGMGEAFK